MTVRNRGDDRITIHCSRCANGIGYAVIEWSQTLPEFWCYTCEAYRNDDDDEE